MFRMKSGTMKIIQSKWNERERLFYENTLKFDNLSIKVKKQYSVYSNKSEMGK